MGADMGTADMGCAFPAVSATGNMINLQDKEAKV